MDSAMHPALHSWRDDLPPILVRFLAYVGGIALLSTIAAHFFQSPPVMDAITPVHRSEWIEVERPFPAFALSIPEAADVPAHYAIRRHAEGGGRKDIISLGQADSAAPYLQVEIYRPGVEQARFGDAKTEIMSGAAALEPAEVTADGDGLASKFGPLSVVTFATTQGVARKCVGFVRAYENPRMQLSGWFCQGSKFGDADYIDRGTLACALDRLTLLAAGSEPKVSALFAQAELNRSYCGQRSPLMAPTPKHRALWGRQAAR
jgi:hypothetical protein